MAERIGAVLRNYEPGGTHTHQHPHRHADGSLHGERHVHAHDGPAHDRDAYSDGGHDGFGVGMARRVRGDRACGGGRDGPERT